MYLTSRILVGSGVNPILVFPGSNGLIGSSVYSLSFCEILVVYRLFLIEPNLPSDLTSISFLGLCSMLSLSSIITFSWRLVSCLVIVVFDFERRFTTSFFSSFVSYVNFQIQGYFYYSSTRNSSKFASCSKSSLSLKSNLVYLRTISYCFQNRTTKSWFVELCIFIKGTSYTIVNFKMR